MPYLLGYQKILDNGNKKWQYVSKYPEDIVYYIPKYGRDQRDRFISSIQDYYYVSLPYQEDKLVPYYKTFGFYSLDQVANSNQKKMCGQSNCVSITDHIDNIDNICESCDKLVCYTCRKEFKECFICRRLICKKCWNSDIKCLMCQNNFIKNNTLNLLSPNE